MTDTLATPDDRPVPALRTGVRSPFDPSSFDAAFATIAADALGREVDRRQPYDAVALLKVARFGAARVPVERGGLGASLPELFELVTTLAAADPNVAHLFRGHFAFVEHQLVSPDHDRRDRWLDRVAGGAIVGNASSERNGRAQGDLDTTLRRDGERWLLNGTKYYSTGTIFADWISAAALRDGERVTVAVDAGAPGVRRIDDWDGFGQRLTGSGTTVFDDVEIDPANVRPVAAAPAAGTTGGSGAPGGSPQQGFFQLYLLAVLAGIGRAVVADAVDFVRPRARVYRTSAGALPRHDPQVQAVVGRLSAASFTADTLVQESARHLQNAADSLSPHGLDPDLVALAELQVYRAQLIVIDLVLDAATQLFEVGGASATSEDRRLDRHWRNARTLASHNPAIYKARLIGDHVLNGTSPVVGWAKPPSAGDPA